MRDIRIEHVFGVLIRDDGTRIPVQLMLTVVYHPVDKSESAVSKCELVTQNVTDGDYTVEYFYRQPFREPVRVQYGVLVSRGG